MTERLRRNKALRQSCINEISVINDVAIAATTDKSQHTKFKVRYVNVEFISDEFLKYHGIIVGILSSDQGSDLDAEDVVKTEFSDCYYNIKTIYADLFEHEVNMTNRTLNQSTGNVFTDISHVKLPKIELTRFSGDVRDFSAFKDMFDAVVHLNPALKPVEKFNYLKSSLDGTPLELIKRLKATADNYQTAYDALVNRYNNPRAQARLYWLGIEKFPPMKNEDPVVLRKLLDTFAINLESLKNMGIQIDCDFVLSHMLLSRIDPETARCFEREHSSTSIPQYLTLFKFLESHCNGLENLDLSSHSKPPVSKPRFSNLPRAKNSFHANTARVKKCLLCKETHHLWNCSQFLSKSPRGRHHFCKNRRVCFVCLSNSHDLGKCSSTDSCKHCSSTTHHSLLHFVKQTPGGDASGMSLPSTAEIEDRSAGSSQQRQNLDEENSSAFLCGASMKSSSKVLLATAMVEIRNSYGYFKQFRAMLDSGSEISVISQKCLNPLHNRPKRTSATIRGIGNQEQISNLGSVSLSIRPVGKRDPVITLDALVLPKICENLPTTDIHKKSWHYLDKLDLADKYFFKPGEIDLLLGADVFFNVLGPDRVLGVHGGPNALQTMFGYVLIGKIDDNNPSQGLVNSFVCNDINTMNSFENSMREFFSIETVPEFKSLSVSDKECEDIFLNNFYRTDEGKYVVPLPFKNELPTFALSRPLAIRRFLALERRLLRNPELYKNYCAVIQDYLDLQHMEIVEPINNNSSHFYLPHHAVVRPDHASTKVRVVFNASARAYQEKSLNDCLHVGPKLQTEIATILLNFRFHQVCFTADIKQMYRQIFITPEVRDYQRIIFRFSPDDDLLDLRINVVCFGVCSSPYLALRTLHQLAKDEGDAYPVASRVLIEDTYIDDICTGSNSLADAQFLRDDLISLLSKAGFELRKWTCNDPEFLKVFPPDQISFDPMSFFENEIGPSIKILGLLWDPAGDNFCYRVHPIDRPCTKRNLLSELARIFDPLGFLAPVTFFCKYLIQKLWSLGLDWDESPPDDFFRLWCKYKNELTELSSIRVPRCINLLSNTRTELHGFSDASERGYSAVVYLRAIKNDCDIQTFFLCGKSKVAPRAKILSIPRMELCGAVLLTKLISWLQPILEQKLKIDSVHAYTDSQIVLAWLNADPRKWQTFVANRSAYIRERIDPTFWAYVKSPANPADCASRGLFPAELVHHDLWMKGPEFLRLPNYATDTRLIVETHEEERKTVLCVINEFNFIDHLLHQFSSFSKIQRVVGYVQRFIFNCRNSKNKREGFLTNSDLTIALQTLVKRTQFLNFEEEIQRERFSKPLKKLNVFVDPSGIVRVGGRLTLSKLNYDKKHPILLPQKCRLVELIIDFYHKKYFHAGLRTTQFLISQTFWILSSRRAIRAILSKCIICWKMKPVPAQPLMGNLPTVRISQVKPFLHTGVDYGDPFAITMGKYRGAKVTKAYICLFVCMATKAIHLELSSDLSTDAFLAAFRRFVSRRGKCSHIYSDLGTNFVGASNELKRIVQTAAHAESIEYHFLPGSAPHMGGLWESGIKSVKSHLNRVIGEQILNYEEFYTFLVQIEGILNSRPLTPLSSDPNDLNVLTPGHFLTLAPLDAIPDDDLTDISLNRLNRWQLIQRLHQDFWKRWHVEYLHTLQQRSKWLDSKLSPNEGDLVLIKSDNLPPQKWSLGRISALHRGTDGVARVATVKTQAGMIKRPLVKLCPLPTD